MATYTTNFNLFKPSTGSTNWGIGVDSNFDTIDARMASPLGATNIVTYTSTAIFDLSKGHVQYCKLTGDLLTPQVVNPLDGQLYKFIIKQDSVGGHTFTFPAAFLGAGKIAPSEGNTAANAVNIQVFTWVAADSAFYPWGPMITV